MRVDRLGYVSYDLSLAVIEFGLGQEEADTSRTLKNSSSD